MTPAIAALGAFALYWLGYRYYARHLATRVFSLDPERPTPAHAREDGVDYVPTRPLVLFGHHFASITGLAPMLGPAVAVIWGWAPALLWVVFGALLVGCVHDFAALVLSVRDRGLSIASVAEGILGPRARTLFHLIIFFGVSLAMGVFVFVIGTLFELHASELEGARGLGYSEAVLPSALLMVIAVVAGFLLRRGVPLWSVALGGFLLTLLGIRLGLDLPTMGLDPAAWPARRGWILILLAYAFAACILPVWTLLQSRDFLNSLLLYFGLGLAYVGLFVGNPEFAAPAFVAEPAGAPPILPFVFIVIACGAASGFHGLVSSGTTAKQLDRETDARPVAYGGMIGESLLGLLATLACTAGFASPQTWHQHYLTWGASQGLGHKISAFIQGTTTFLATLSIPRDLAAALVAMVVVSFALTTLDSATRLLRFNIEEIGTTFRIPFTRNRYVASLLACVTIFWFADARIGNRPAGLALWELFGTTNQVLAGLTLLTVTVYLVRRRRNPWLTGIPMVFMLGTTLVAMVLNLGRFTNGWTFEDGPGGPISWPLLGTAAILLILAVWLIVEAALAFRSRVSFTKNPDEPSFRSRVSFNKNSDDPSS